VEYKRFAGVKFEIQIRSILQHTWAEIEHDIGYKAKIEVPKQIRRKFSRLAGLLELADDQFVQIRDDLANYERIIQESIITEPENIGIDAVSIYEYANNSPTVGALDKKVVQLASLRLKSLDRKDAARHLKYLKYFEIETISQLEVELIDNSELIVKRAKDVESNHEEVSKGISIFYLHQVLAAKRFTRFEIGIFLDKMELSMPLERNEFADYLSTLVDKGV
jgi:putative GTP pyrophosphokinase